MENKTKDSQRRVYAVETCKYTGCGRKFDRTKPKKEDHLFCSSGCRFEYWHLEKIRKGRLNLICRGGVFAFE